jgi:hypothetical protein
MLDAQQQICDGQIDAHSASFTMALQRVADQEFDDSELVEALEESRP